MNTMILAAQFRYHESVGGWVAPTVSSTSSFLHISALLISFVFRSPPFFVPKVSEADIATSVGHDEKAACVFNFFKSKEST